MGRIDNTEIFENCCESGETLSLKEAIETLYCVHGKACANMLIGDFAVALWDPQESAVICFRDIVGCQPVYYTVNHDRLVISHSIENLISRDDVNREIDDRFVVPALSRFFNHPEHTFLKHIRKIPPAHILTIRPDGIKRERYWRPEDIKPLDYTNSGALHEKFRCLLKKAIQDRLPDNGKIGVHVSGGLDCSAVAILATEILKNEGKAPPDTFSWQPPPDEKPPDNEKVYRDLAPDVYDAIETVCTHANLKISYCPVSKEDFLQIWNRNDTVDRICGATYSEWPVMREASARDVQYMLCGFGGDEIASFSGRGHFQGLALKGRWIKLYKIARKKRVSPLAFIIRNFISGLENLFIPERLFSQYSVSVRNGLPRWKILVRLLLNKNHTRFLLNREERKSIEPTFPYLSELALQIKNPLPPWKTQRQISARKVLKSTLHYGNLTNRIESWANDGAKQGIQYLYPLLDKRIIEFTLGLPEHAFNNGEHSRLFFKTAMSDILPASIGWQSKMMENARIANGLPAAKEALADFSDYLSQGDFDTTRAKYIDIERLQRAITPAALKQRDYLAKVYFAVQFLGMKQK